MHFKMIKDNNALYVNYFSLLLLYKIAFLIIHTGIIFLKFIYIYIYIYIHIIISCTKCTQNMSQIDSTNKNEACKQKEEKTSIMQDIHIYIYLNIEFLYTYGTG